MFLLGIFSISQIIFLPGFILLKVLKIRSENFLQIFLYSFGLSLVFNFYLICVLTSLDLYSREIIFILFSFEVIILIYFLVIGRINTSFNKTVKDYYSNFHNFLKKLPVLHKLLFIIISLFILFFVSTIYVNIGTVNYFVDTFNIKWWSDEWYANHFFIYSHYPQLIPINLSLVHKFFNYTPPDFLLKLFMPLFYIGILLIFLDLSFKGETVAHLTAFIIYTLILLIFYGILFISDLNLDIPVTFLGFLSFYSIKKRKKPGFDLQAVLLSATFAVSAANIKLVGFYIVLMSLIWILYYYFKNKNKISISIFKIISCTSIIYIVGLFWYIFFPSFMFGGVSNSPYQPKSSLYENFLFGINLVTNNFGQAFTILILIGLFFSLFTPKRKIVLIIITPLFFIWASRYSYDCRNLSLILPFTAYASAFGLKFILSKIRNEFRKLGGNQKNIYTNYTFKKRKRLPLFLLIIFLFTLIIIVNTNTFFNLGMNIAYFFRSHYFNYNTLIYTTELGFYKYVLYYINSITILILLSLFFLSINKTKIKIKHLLIFTGVGMIILNFTIFNEENLFEYQNNDRRMVEMHNLYYELHPYLINSNKTILTNSLSFSKLIFPDGIEINYTPNLEMSESQNVNYKSKWDYILLEKNKIKNKTGKDFYKMLDSNYTTYLDNDAFFFADCKR